MVARCDLITSADPRWVAVLLGRAWMEDPIRARTGRVVDLGSGVYDMTVSCDTIRVMIAPRGTGSLLVAQVVASMTWQSRTMFIPTGPQHVDADILIKDVIERRLQLMLRAQAHTAAYSATKVPFGAAMTQTSPADAPLHPNAARDPKLAARAGSTAWPTASAEPAAACVNADCDAFGIPVRLDVCDICGGPVVARSAVAASGGGVVQPPAPVRRPDVGEVLATASRVCANEQCDAAGLPTRYTVCDVCGRPTHPPDHA